MKSFVITVFIAVFVSGSLLISSGGCAKKHVIGQHPTEQPELVAVDPPAEPTTSLNENKIIAQSKQSPAELYPNGEKPLDKVLKMAGNYFRNNNAVDFDKVFSEEIMKSAVKYKSLSNPSKIKGFLRSLDQKDIITERDAKVTYLKYFSPYDIVTFKYNYPDRTNSELCSIKGQIIKELEEELGAKRRGMLSATGANNTSHWQTAFQQAKGNIENLQYEFLSLCKY
ncbi:hypothetical protein ACFL03_08830 [Thermodesulfobacteriota bacterium]